MKKKASSPRTLHKTLSQRRSPRRPHQGSEPEVIIENNREAEPEAVQRRWGAWMIGGIVTAAILMVAVVVWSRARVASSPIISSSPVVTQQPSEQIPTPSWQRALDGVVVSSEAAAQPPLVAISVDNMIDARPQSGIDQALWVFEFPAEASITRWLAVFAAPLGEPRPSMVRAADQSDVAEIGPVRSLRPYMAEIARSISAVVVYSGGSQQALALVTRFARDYPSINEFSNASLFWRDRDRPGPHNLYTSVLRLARHPLLGQNRLVPLEPLTWSNPITTVSSDSGDKILTIGYREPYTARWQYRSSGRTFERIDDKGNVMTLRDGKAITTQTIVVQSTDVKILDWVGRRSIRLTGTGEVMVFSAGQVELGQWKRSKPSDRTGIFTADGRPIPITPGRLWWSVVPTGTEVKFE